jgi:SAM-dependent methyltransferase
LSDRRLVLGCGARPLDGAVNHDRTKHSPRVDVAHDLNVYPWPWADGEFSTVFAIDVLEHLYDLQRALEECHRITAEGGILILQAPAAGVTVSHRDPTHRWFLTRESMDYYIEGRAMCRDYGFYSPMRWAEMDCGWYGPEKENIRWTLRKMPSAVKA